MCLLGLCPYTDLFLAPPYCCITWTRYFCLTLNFGRQVGDKRHLDDLRAFIRSILTGQLVNESDLDEAEGILFEKSGGYFVYIASIVAMFEGEKKWTIAELQDLPDGLDGIYCDNFARILEPSQEDVPYVIDKVSKWYCSVVTQYLV